jgi:hypothetical protein
MGSDGGRKAVMSPATWRPKMARKRRKEAMMTKLTKSGWESWARGFGHALVFWPCPGTRGWETSGMGSSQM